MVLGNDPDRERFGAISDGNKTVDIGMGTGTATRIGGVFAEHIETVTGGFGIERTEGRLKVLIDRDRALLSGLILDGGDDCASPVDQVDTRDGVDGWKLLQVVFERRTRGYHGLGFLVVGS